MKVNLHGLTLAFYSPETALRERFGLVYGHLPPAADEPDITLRWQLHPEPVAPSPPPGLPVRSADERVGYYGRGPEVVIRLPKYGLIRLDLESQQLNGLVTRNCLDVYGAFEDVLMISLAPLYRRRGWFALHAFAACSPGGPAALITGAIGSGKTTTGLALLAAGWKLLSNDSPLLTDRAGQIQVLAYPGRLSAFDDSLARFERLKKFIPTEPDRSTDKRVFRAEAAFPDPWTDSGMAGGVFFPQIEPELRHSALEPVDPTQAVLQLIPQAIEGWDKAAIADNLRLLRGLVEQVPCYTLRLSPDVAQLPPLIAQGMG